MGAEVKLYAWTWIEVLASPSTSTSAAVGLPPGEKYTVMAGSCENLSNSIGFAEPLGGWVKVRRAKKDQEIQLDQNLPLTGRNILMWLSMVGSSPHTRGKLHEGFPRVNCF